jgi:hypothetical protein
LLFPALSAGALIVPIRVSSKGSAFHWTTSAAFQIERVQCFYFEMSLPLVLKKSLIAMTVGDGTVDAE